MEDSEVCVGATVEVLLAGPYADGTRVTRRGVVVHGPRAVAAYDGSTHYVWQVRFPGGSTSELRSSELAHPDAITRLADLAQ